jgi:4-amino-4-deoxy-L-arabinose transferase-like glycosyltransferase
LFLFLMWRLSDRDVGGWLPIVWIAALVLFGVVIYVFDRRANIALSPSLQWRDVILIVLLFVLGLVVGTYRLAQVPNSFIGDEGTFWDTARAIAVGEYRPPIFDFGVYSYPILGSFYQALILKIFGFSVWSWRFASVLIAVAAVVPTYLLAREMFDRRVAGLASAVMVVTPYFIAVERLGYNNAQALLPVALALFFLYAGLKRGSAFYLYLGGVAAGLGFYSYTAGRLALVVGVLYFAYLFVRRLFQKFGTTAKPFREAFRPLVVLGVVFGIGWAATALPHLAFGSAANSELLRTKTLESVFANDIYARDFLPGEDLYRDVPPIQIGPYTLFYRTDLIARLLVRGGVRSFLVFQHAKLVTEHFIAGPLAGPAATIFYFLGLVITLVSFKRKTFALLGVWFLSGVFLLSVISTFPPRHMHMVSIIPALSILTAVGIIAAADFIAEHIARWRRAASFAIAIGCLFVIGLTGLNNYFVTVQQTYLPIPEHIMGFAQLELKSSRQMIYIYSDPAEKDFAPWETKAIPNLGEFHAVAREDLINNRLTIEPGKAYTFFFKDQDRETTVNYLTRILNREIDPKPYFNREGQVILMSYAFGD